MNTILKITIILAVISLIGCSNRIGDFTVISSKNFDLTQDAHYILTKNRVIGEDGSPTFFGAPLRGTISMKTAMDRALEKTPGTVALADAVISEKWASFIFGYSSIIVEGTPIINPKLQASFK